MKLWIGVVVVLALLLVGAYFVFASQRVRCEVLLTATGNISDATNCKLERCFFDMPSSPTAGVRLLADDQVIGAAPLTSNYAVVKGGCRQPIKDVYTIEIFDTAGTLASKQYWMGGAN